MSKESIPLGPLCSECDRYTTCRTLCTYAEQYVNQDYVPGDDATNGYYVKTFSELGLDQNDFSHDFTSLVSTSKKTHKKQNKGIFEI